MTTGEPPYEPDQASERIGEILRIALPSVEDVPLEDETRRLMLHLSVEPLERPRVVASASSQPEKASLLRRVWKRRS